MHKYRLVAKKGEGTFSEVLKAQCIKNGKYYAIKCMKNHFDSLDQVNNLREIQALRRLSPHPNIIKLTEVLYRNKIKGLNWYSLLLRSFLLQLQKSAQAWEPPKKTIV